MARWSRLSKRTKTAEERQLRSAAAMLLGAVVGLAAAVMSGLALVPRVRLVDMVGVLAGGIGCGASLVGAVVQFKEARRSAARARDGVDR